MAQMAVRRPWILPRWCPGAGRGKRRARAGGAVTEDEAHTGEEGLDQADRAEGRASRVEMDFVLVRTGSQESQVRTWGRGLLKHTHSLTAFWGLPFEDIAVIGPRGSSKGKDWRRTAIF